jgi:hypothetical protein
MTAAIPTLLLGSWVVVTILLYWQLGGRRAALIAIIGGWAFLPTGDYSAEVLRVGSEIGGPTHAVAIPGLPWFNKATAIGLGCLCGAVLFDWLTLRRARPRWFDLPAALWILVPIASTAANGNPIAGGLAQSRHLALAWGVPYAIGRVWFADGPALRSFARAWLAAGVAYLPLGLAEFAAGPFWYHAFYGGHVYRFSGSERWVGHRPLVFLEDGNQLGMWAATAAVAAAWLWALGDLPSWGGRRLRVPGVAVVASLIAASLLWQSHGSIILMLLALLPLIAIGQSGEYRRWLIVAGVFLVIAVVAALTSMVIVGGPGGIQGQLRSLFHGIGKQSFTWRLARIVEDFPQLAQRPILGWGRADWSGLSPDGSFQDPIALSFWFLVTGMYGALGLLASASLLLLPIAASASRVRSLGWNSSPWSFVALTAVILSLNVADLAMNSGFLLPMLVAAGGLNGLNLGRPHSRPGRSDAPNSR